MCLSVTTSNQELLCHIKASQKGLRLSVLISHANFPLMSALYYPLVDCQENTGN
jgi:hypothetical protein